MVDLRCENYNEGHGLQIRASVCDNGLDATDLVFMSILGARIPAPGQVTTMCKWKGANEALDLTGVRL